MLKNRSFSKSLIVAMVGCLILTVVRSSIVNSKDEWSKTSTSISTGSNYVCDSTSLSAFGFEMKPDSKENEKCPRVRQNCCSKKDLELLEKIHRLSDDKMTDYYSTYLAIHRYILGLGHVYERIAQQVNEWSRREKARRMDLRKNGVKSTVSRKPIKQPSEHFVIKFHKSCETASYKIRMVDYKNRVFIERYYEALVNRFMFLKRARRGFFCSFCEAEQINWHQIEQEQGRLRSRLTGSFCQSLFDWSYNTVTQNYLNFSVYLRYLLTLLSCVVPNKKNVFETPVETDEDAFIGPLTIEDYQLKASLPFSVFLDHRKKNPISKLPEPLRHMLENPISMKREFYMKNCGDQMTPGHLTKTKCSDFCQNFEFASANKILDGNLDELYALFLQLKNYEFVKPNLKATLFSDRIDVLKKKIEDGYLKLDNNYRFILLSKGHYMPFITKSYFSNLQTAANLMDLTAQSKLNITSLNSLLLSATIVWILTICSHM